ncbi:uncharacterized protein LOC144576367 isoform X4 [Callithrix jacchus]
MKLNSPGAQTVKNSSPTSLLIATICTPAQSSPLQTVAQVLGMRQSGAAPTTAAVPPSRPIKDRSPGHVGLGALSSGSTDTWQPLDAATPVANTSRQTGQVETNRNLYPPLPVSTGWCERGPPAAPQRGRRQQMFPARRWRCDHSSPAHSYGVWQGRTGLALFLLPGGLWVPSRWPNLPVPGQC